MSIVFGEIVKTEEGFGLYCGSSGTHPIPSNIKPIFKPPRHGRDLPNPELPLEKLVGRSAWGRVKNKEDEHPWGKPLVMLELDPEVDVDTLWKDWQAVVDREREKEKEKEGGYD